ncbi:MAG: YfhO family protein, partial [Bacilli bacterium]|nr:YfhO family protein [Bacilli bacterium]
ISTFLMILMSYYYSVVGIIVFIVYGIYRYIGLHEKITLRGFLLDGIKFVIPILIGVLMSCILIVPTFLVILSGRGATTVTITLKDILMPGVYLNYILYKPYGIGLSAIVIFALIHLFFKKRENKFLAIMLTLILVLPFCNYIFNATMYIDAKSLIPFLPLYILVIVAFIHNIFEKEVQFLPVVILGILFVLLGARTLGNLRYILYVDALVFLLVWFLYSKTNYRSLMGVSLCILSCLITLFTSKQDTLVDKELIYGEEYILQKNVTNAVTEQDADIYRISTQISPLANTNRTYNDIRYYQTTLYSSTYNMNYNKFYYDVMNNPMQSRNRVITSSAKNYPFLLLMGNKYIISENKPFIGYEQVLNEGGVIAYKNENALPLGYSSSHLMSLADFEKLGYPYNQEAILKNIIVDKDVSNDFEGHLKKIDLKFDTKELEKLDITKEDGVTVIDIPEKTKINLKLDKAMHNQLLYIHFEITEANSCKIGDSTITINGVSNKLTCNPWKYHNGNYEFDYVISKEDIKSLSVTFSKGVYRIKNLAYYVLDYQYIDDLNSLVDAFEIDADKTKGDFIEGDIDVQDDGYFVLSVPYDNGFHITVDGKETEYEKTNVAFIGFPIEKGSHHIQIEYVAPGKKLGSYLSIAGVVLLVGTVIYEERRGRKKDERRNTKK